MIRTKIVCTIGPSVNESYQLERLIRCGMDVARINFSHGVHEEHQKTIERIKQARELCKRPIAIMIDTRGPEIRVGEISNGSLEVSAGMRITLVSEEVQAEGTLPIRPELVLPALEKGNLVLFDNGYIQARVVDKVEGRVVVEFLNSGTLLSSKGVNIPGVELPLPPVTEKDIADIEFGCEQGVELVAASFIRNAENVLEIKRLLGQCQRSDMLVIAKIECLQGVENFESILHVADGIMIARGDLGVEIPVCEVPRLQKMMIKKSNLVGKPVVIATQMLESMMNNPRPTRAEVSDVANAIYDGGSAIMLSGETAVGKYPIETVEMMRSIAMDAEDDFDYASFFNLHTALTYHDIPSALTLSAVKTSYSLDARAIFCFTMSGGTARLLSRLKPKVPIIAFTTESLTYHQLALSWGVLPVMCEKGSDRVQDAFEFASNWGLEQGIVSYGDLVILTTGSPFWVAGTTNTVMVDCIGDVLARGSKGVGKRVYGTVALVPGPLPKGSYVTPGSILVLACYNEDYSSLVKGAAGVLLQSSPEDTESERQLFQACRKEGKTCILGVDSAFRVLRESQLVTLDPEKKTVYKGVIR